MEIGDLLAALFRWFHIAAGILWIGLLYFFNFVNAHFSAALDADAKKKVVPELMPRALYFFRWGALVTWVTGLLLLGYVFYQGGLMFDQGGEAGWGTMPRTMLNELYSSGVISTSALRDLEGLFQVRSAIVHGFSAPAADPGTVRFLVDTARRLLAESEPVKQTA